MKTETELKGEIEQLEKEIKQIEKQQDTAILYTLILFIAVLIIKLILLLRGG